MISKLTERRYSIGQVSEMTQVATHLLRQWEEKFPQLKPKRNSGGRRYYMPADIEIVKRIKYLLRHEKMTIQGARIRLAQELHGEGRPKTNREVIQLLDKIEEEARAMLSLLSSVE